MRLWSVDEAVASIALAARTGTSTLAAGAEAVRLLTGARCARATYSAGDEVQSETRGGHADGDEGHWVSHCASAGAGAEVVVEAFQPRSNDGLGAVAEVLGMALERTRLARETESTRTIYRTLVEQLPAVTYYRAIDEPGVVAYISPQVESTFGFTQTDFVKEPDLWKRRLHPDDAARILEEQQRMRPEATGAPVRAEYRLVRRDGQIIWVENHAHAVRDASGRVRFVLGVIFDVTERKQLEEELTRAHRLEAVGKLAGGVAHEFNNLMTIVTGRGHALLATLSPDDPHAAELGEITRAGERAAELTRQLLALGRRRAQAPSVVDPRALIATASAELTRRLGGAIALHIDSARCTRCVKADPTSIGQILLSLIDNARDAMPGGGTLRIDVDDFDVAFARSAGPMRVAPGAYVRLTIRDSGDGVPPEIAARIFEPFVSSKDASLHSGLGLATSLGLAEQCGGTLYLEPERGMGAAFTLLLPACDEKPTLPSPTPQEQTSAITGRHTVLLVEDDEQVRSLVGTMLQRLGYHVLTARTGQEALSIATAYEGDIAALLTDVVMPSMDGFELADRIGAVRAETRVVFMSGYHDEASARRGRSQEAGQAMVLPKPFSMAKLGQHLAAALAQRGR